MNYFVLNSAPCSGCTNQNKECAVISVYWLWKSIEVLGGEFLSAEYPASRAGLSIVLADICMAHIIIVTYLTSNMPECYPGLAACRHAWFTFGGGEN